MKILALFLMSLSFSVIAETEQDLVSKKIKEVSELYSDGYAGLVHKTIEYRTLYNGKPGEGGIVFYGRFFSW